VKDLKHTRRRRLLSSGTAGLLVAAGILVGSASTAAAATATCYGHKATIVGNSGNNNVYGTEKNDVIYAGAGNDAIYGRGGDDLICGGDGADTIHGGPGNDMVFGGRGQLYTDSRGKRWVKGDTLFDDAGDDFYSPVLDDRYPAYTPDRISFYYAPNGVTVNTATHTATGNGTDHWLGDRAELGGSKYDDVMVGGSHNDVFQGSYGDDKILGNGGADLIRDSPPTAATQDTDTIEGGPGNDVLYTYGGADTLDGGDNDDTLFDFGHDAGTMLGGSGNDNISDALAVNKAQTIDGGSGTDTVALHPDFRTYVRPRILVDLASGQSSFQSSGVGFTVRGADTLDVFGLPLTYAGSEGDDVVYSDGMGAMTASGRAGNDTFIGTRLNDTYDGGLGSDTVATTGGGSDSCTSVERVSSGTCS
jgi:Ca2+-binding RTX toxin-like protein